MGMFEKEEKSEKGKKSKKKTIQPWESIDGLGKELDPLFIKCEDIPIFISKKIDDSYKSKGVLKNYDIFDLALNYG